MAEFRVATTTDGSEQVYSLRTDFINFDSEVKQACRKLSEYAIFNGSVNPDDLPLEEFLDVERQAIDASGIYEAVEPFFGLSNVGVIVAGTLGAGALYLERGHVEQGKVISVELQGHTETALGPYSTILSAPVEIDFV